MRQPAADSAPFSATRGDGLRLAAWERAAVLLAALVAALLLGRTAIALHRIPLNYNEGWMAYFAERALGGTAPLYPAPGGLVTNNYPPLAFYLFGWAGRLVGDTVLGGRLLALAGLAATAGLVFACARRLGADGRAAAAAGVVFLGFNLTIFHTYVGIADPQWLAQAAMATGLLPLLSGRGTRLPVRSVVAACLVMALAGLIKHNLLALPAATSLWLFRHDRRGFLVWVATGLAAVLVAGSAIGLAYGSAAFFDILEHARRMDWDAWPDALVYLVPMAPLGAATFALWRARGAVDRRVELVALFAAFGLVFAVVQRLGEGVNVNAYFEALVALCIAGGAALSWAPRPRWTGWAVVAPALVLAPWFLVETARAVVEAPREAATWRRLTAAVAAAPGPAACEMLSVCYWAGKPFALDFFNTGQRLRAGASAAPLVGPIEARAYGAILVTRDKAYFAGEGRLPLAGARAIEAAYASVDAGPGGLTLMRPRPSAPPRRRG